MELLIVPLWCIDRVKRNNFCYQHYFIFPRCIKAALLPNPEISWVTRPSADLENPRFSEVFRIPIPQRTLFTKTLQVNIWCLQERRPDECYV